MQAVRWFDDIGLGDAGSVGGKGANLGELTAGGLPVPPGFVITGEAYLDTLTRAGVRERLSAILGEVRTASQDDLDRLAAEAKNLVRSVRIPDELAERGASPPMSVLATMSVWPCALRVSARTPKARRSPV